jgi:hypothetical protein
MPRYAKGSALLGPNGPVAGSFVFRHRLLLCSILMAAACALTTLVFTCATPFAALAVFAAAALPLPSALVTVSGTWLLNQAIGYGLLAYPISGESIAWGVALGAAALVATAAAASVLNRPRLRGSVLGYGYGLVAAFVAYEVCLIAVGVALDDLEAFTPAIVTRLALLNLVSFLALVAVWHLGARLVAGPSGQRRLSRAPS